MKIKMDKPPPNKANGSLDADWLLAGAQTQPRKRRMALP